MGSVSLAEATGTPKSEFLASVRRALGRQAGPPQTEYPRLAQGIEQLEDQAREVRERVRANRGALLDKLAEVAQLRGWQVRRTPDPEEAMDYVRSLADGLGANRVVRSRQEVFEAVPLDATLTGMGITVTEVAHGEGASRESLREQIAMSGMGITGVDYAIAETGSAVIVPRRGLGRLVSLVPPVHVALVRPDDVIESLDDLFLMRRLEYMRNGGDMGPYLNFITGPSRTADIEQTIVVGVHGPKEVHMVLLG